MSENQTNRIKIAPEGGGAGGPPTERIAREGGSEDKTVRIDPAGRSDFEDPKGDTLFDQYTVYSRIGTGGMGVVYLARDRRLGRFVAIKRLNGQAQAAPSLRRRFLQEAHAVAALSHVHIVHIYTLGEDEDGPFIVMEYVAGPDAQTSAGPAPEGQTSDAQQPEPEPAAGGLTRPNPPLSLDRMISRNGPLKTDEAIGLILKIGRAIAYAHSAGVIHRDLKPGNILLDKSGEPKIVDFGLARLMQRDVAKLTVPGEKLLSLGYGAPEQESDASLSDQRADVYGLGALLYFTLTGQNPRYFREQDLPPSVRNVVIKALATDRERRWPTADAFNEALHEILTRTQIETPTVKTTWRCKWCDAVNPLSTKYCAECGWDGSERCPECGAETFVGIQYCGACGADARAYETTLQLIKKMRDAFSRKRFEFVVSCSGRVHGFEPAGPSGRRLLAEIAKLRGDAEAAVRKREQLREQIPIEMRAENFERAAAFIKQFRELSGDKLAFDAEERSLPGGLLRRNLLRARRAVQNREWRLAAQLCEELLPAADPGDPDLLFVRKRLGRHAALANGLSATAVFLGIALAYLSAVPLLARLDTPPYSPALRRFCLPGLLFYRLPGIRAASEKYARAVLPEGRTLEAWYAPPAGIPAPGPAAGDVLPPDSMTRLREEYGKKLAEIRKARETFARAWPLDYLRELEQLLEQCRTGGDYEAWQAVNAEYARFRATPRLADEPADPAVSAELSALQSKYRQTLSEQKLADSRRLVTLGKRYVNDLSDLLKQFMQEDKMDFASAVNAEIRRVKTASEQIEAEAVVAKTDAAPGAGEIPPPAAILPSAVTGRIEALETLRAAYDKVMADIEKDTARKNAAWPEQYIAKLADLREAFQRVGDFTGWESANDESIRFDADRSLTEQDVSRGAGRLAALQKEFLRAQDEIRKERDGKIVSGTEAYLKELQTLQSKLTVEGRMDAAAAVNAEIKRVKTRGG